MVGELSQREIRQGIRVATDSGEYFVVSGRFMSNMMDSTILNFTQPKSGDATKELGKIWSKLWKSLSLRGTMLEIIRGLAFSLNGDRERAGKQRGLQEGVR